MNTSFAHQLPWGEAFKQIRFWFYLGKVARKSIGQQVSQYYKASIAVNEEMLMLYWDIGKSIVEKQNQFTWGSKIVEQMAKDLKRELPDTNGFSRTNLFAMRKFYLFYKDSELVHQVGGQLEYYFKSSKRISPASC